jgi:hypothetical protein
VIVLRATLVVVGLFYILLWVIALNGATSLIAPLVVPLVLAALVALGVALNRFMGITPRKQHFNDRDDSSQS